LKRLTRAELIREIFKLANEKHRAEDVPACAPIGLLNGEAELLAIGDVCRISDDLDASLHGPSRACFGASQTTSTLQRFRLYRKQ
jgi:hypothetical protein